MLVVAELNSSFFAEAWHGRSIPRRQKCYVLGQTDNCTQDGRSTKELYQSKSTWVLQ